VDKGAFEGGEVGQTSGLGLLARFDGEGLEAGSFGGIPFPLHGIGQADGQLATVQVRGVSGGQGLVGGECDGGVEAGHGGWWVMGCWYYSNLRGGGGGSQSAYWKRM